MKFEFKPTENVISFREYLDYLKQTSPVTSIYIMTIFPTVLIIMFSLITSLLSKYYKTFAYIIIATIIALIICFLIMLLIMKLTKSKKNKVIKNNNLYCDIESTFFFTIEDDYLIRENEFSIIKLHLNKIKNIKLLKHSLILSTENDSASIFIPTAILPVSTEEFIALIKDKNPSVTILEEFKRLKKSTTKRIILLIITFILAFIFSFFIGKYSFTRYDLVMGNNLIKQNDNTIIYENDTLGFSLAFPSKWEGKFGIEERKDRVNVYYLADGKQSHDTTLLFSIRGLGVFFSDINFNIIKNEGLYLFVGPTKIDLYKDSEECLEYMELYEDIKNVKLRENSYHQA